MRVQFDPEAPALMGVRPEDTAIEVPDDLATSTPERRRTRARKVPTPEQREAYQEAVRPGIDAVTMEVGQ